MGSFWALICSTVWVLVSLSSASNELPQIEQVEVFPEPFISEKDPPSFVPRSFPGPPVLDYPVLFPPSRPTANNLQAICLSGDRRPLYSDSYFPASGFGQQKHMAEAVNNLEAWYGKCCEDYQTGDSKRTLCCATQAWELTVENFCMKDLSVKRRWYHCCKMSGSERLNCFNSDAPNPNYEATEEIPLPPLPATESFIFDPLSCQRKSMAPHGVRASRRKQVTSSISQRVNINFPPGRPTADTIESLCDNQNQRPRYSVKCLPRMGYGWLVRQAKSINRMENGFKKCCKKKGDVLSCADQKWSEELNRFCRVQKAGEDGSQCCSSEGENERYTCFQNISPDPHYNVTSATEELSLNKICDTHKIIKNRLPSEETPQCISKILMDAITKATSVLRTSSIRKMAPSEIPGSSGTTQSMKKTIGHRGVETTTGETTYKKTTSSALKGAIQLGITHTIGSLSQKAERDVLMQDFVVVESIFFPGEGSNLTPAHHYSDFRFKTYAPIAFRYFRELFGIRPDDYLYSLCSEPLIELSNPGASGSLFYVSSDDEFIIKTVQHKEAEFLQKLLPGYFMNINQNKRTLLPKFYGLYCVQAGGKNIRIVVMNNLLPRIIPMHLKYDLKGSTYKRRASPKEREKAVPTYKDLDFIQDLPDGLLLEADNYNALCKTIQRDCLSFKIMDYSLLMGIHNMDQASRERERAGGNSGDSGGSEGAVTPDQRRPQAQKSLYCTAMESIQGEARGKGALDSEDHMGGIPARNSKGERLLIYIGIIDILQSYRFIKKLEHSWKALVHDGDTVSVHRPGFYAERFQQFMCSTVFKRIPLKPSPSKKSRGGGQGGLRRAPTLGAPTPLSHARDSLTPDWCTIATSKAQSPRPTVMGRPDLVPRTPPLVDNAADCEANLSTSSLGSTGIASTSPPLRSVGVEVHKSANTDHDQGASHSFEAEVVVDNSGNLSGNEDVVSLSDIVPETNICF
ncbi:hypothetical protein INR49_005527, partial [Caranx melampygus]